MVKRHVRSVVWCTWCACAMRFCQTNHHSCIKRQNLKYPMYPVTSYMYFSSYFSSHKITQTHSQTIIQPLHYSHIVTHTYTHTHTQSKNSKMVNPSPVSEQPFNDKTHITRYTVHVHTHLYMYYSKNEKRSILPIRAPNKGFPRVRGLAELNCNFKVSYFHFSIIGKKNVRTLGECCTHIFSININISINVLL